MIKSMSSILVTAVLTFSLTACGISSSGGMTELVSPNTPQAETTAETTPIASSEETAQEDNKQMVLKFNDIEIPVTWEDNDTVKELEQQVSTEAISVSMSMYGGNEQVGSLGKSYTRNDSQMTTKSGDIVLYSGNQIVVFCGSNSWSYTMFGKMDLSDKEVAEYLSNGDILLTLSIE